MSQETKNYQYERNDFNTYGVRGSASGGTEVVANPTLAGTESALTGLQVGDTKYKVDSGMTNPMTTAGDIIVGGTDGTPTRLAKPTANRTQFLANANGNIHYRDITNTDIYNDSGSHMYRALFANGGIGSTIAYGKPASDFGLGALTTAPSSANTDGYKLVVTSTDPATKYDGYIYYITEA